MKYDLTKVPKHPLRIKVYGDKEKIIKTYELLKELGYSVAYTDYLELWIRAKAYYLNINNLVENYKCIGWDYEDVSDTGDTMEYEELLELVSIKEVKMKKYLVKSARGEYSPVEHHSGFDKESLVEIPEGAEIAMIASQGHNNVIFWKCHGRYIFKNGNWKDCEEAGSITAEEFKDCWERHKVVWTLSDEVSTKEDNTNNLKLEWFEKFLNGVKVQYRIGSAVGSETSQWNNLTWNALKNLQHSLIEFREAPKYVVLNGITFKDKESLLRHIANNYNLD